MTAPDVLVLGCGSIGSRHARNLRALGVEHVHVHDPDDERARALAAEIGGQPAAADADAPVVLVCTPTSLHLEHAAAAVARGADVFVEKPLAHTLDGVRALLDDADTAGRLVMVGYNLRFDRCVQRMREWFDEGRIGRLLSSRFAYSGSLATRHPGEDYRVGYGARADLGGGTILDTIHEIDVALLLGGDVERVYCVAGHLSSLEIDTEDVAELLLTRADGTASSVHFDYLGRPNRRRHELVGDDGTIQSDLVARTVTLHTDDGDETFGDDSDANDSYVRELAHFLDAVATRGPLASSARETLRSLEVALAAKESAATGSPVEL